VPPGSIAKGEALIKGGESGKTIPCAICHGEALKGMGEVPRLAGQQPLYIARQLAAAALGVFGSPSRAMASCWRPSRIEVS
jgi:cytochrome c553